MVDPWLDQLLQGVPDTMKDKRAPLMALALAGIAAPAASASTITETTDFSNNPASPTNLGAFNPGTDVIQGTMSSPSDFNDLILLTGPAGTPITIPFSFHGPSNPGFFLVIFDNPPFSGQLANVSFNPLSGDGSSSVSFVVPADGNYMVQLGIESTGLTSYTLGAAVPEPATLALLATGLAVGAIARRRKKSTKKS